MEVIVNPKTLEGGVNILQLETAVGAAMKCFENGIGVNVPRSRFLPVKKSSDLLLIMSNLYTLKNGFLSMSPNRMFQTTPLVKLGDQNFSKVIINKCSVNQAVQSPVILFLFSLPNFIWALRKLKHIHICIHVRFCPICKSVYFRQCQFEICPL